MHASDPAGCSARHGREHGAGRGGPAYDVFRPPLLSLQGSNRGGGGQGRPCGSPAGGAARHGREPRQQAAGAAAGRSPSGCSARHGREQGRGRAGAARRQAPACAGVGHWRLDQGGGQGRLAATPAGDAAPLPPPSPPPPPPGCRRGARERTLRRAEGPRRPRQAAGVPRPAARV